MNSIISISGKILSVLCYGNIYLGSILYIIASIAICFLLIRRNYNNVIITILLNDDIEKIRKKYEKDHKEASLQISSLLLKNQYAMLGSVGINIFKVILGVIFGFAFCSESIRALSTSIPFDLSMYGYKFFTYSFGEGFLMILVIILCDTCVLNSITSVTRYAAFDSMSSDQIISLIVSLFCLITPVAYGLFIIVFSVCETLIITLNLTKFRQKNLDAKKQFLNHYNPKSGSLKKGR